MFSSCFLWGKSAGCIPPQARLRHHQSGLAGGSTRSAPVPPDIPNLSVLSHGDAPHHWPGRPTGSSTSTSLSRTGQDDDATRCPPHPTFPLPVTGSAPINHSGRPGLHMNYALGVILILQIDFSQTFLRKHTHGNSHPI